MISKSESHMYNAESTLELFESLYETAFRDKRRKIGEHVRKCPGMLVSDAFTGNSAWRSGERERRKMWLDACNIHQASPPPGGWSAHGQPCDASHDVFRYCACHN